MGRKSELKAVSEPKPVTVSQTTVVVVDKDTAKGVEMMTTAELVAVHEELCPGEPPWCTRTYHPRDYRAHVLLLIAEKQKRIATGERIDEPRNESR